MMERMVHEIANVNKSFNPVKTREFVKECMAEAVRFVTAARSYPDTTISYVVSMQEHNPLDLDSHPWRNCIGVTSRLWEIQPTEANRYQYQLRTDLFVDTGH